CIIVVFGLMLAGSLSIQSYWAGTAMGAFVLMFVSLPNALVAWKTLSRHCFAIWSGLFCPFLHPAFASLVGLGLIPNAEPPGLDDSTAAVIVVVIVLMLNCMQFLSYLLALRAYYANRHIPGFVPQPRAGA